MKENVIQVKSFKLAKEVVFLYQFLTREKREYILSKQVLRSGTSVGANVAEGTAGYTKKDFSHRMNIAYKEARETSFWVRLLFETGYITREKADPILSICDEVIRILFSILRTSSQAK